MLRWMSCLWLAAMACAAPRPVPAVPQAEGVTLRELAPGVWMHTSWKELPGVGPFPSNGLVVLGPREALLVDTAWGDAPTAALLDEIEKGLHRRVSRAIVTHSHDDRMGGIRELLRRGIVVHALTKTAERARAEGEPVPSELFDREASIVVDGVRAEAFYPGPAHAPDNVVVWLPASRLLFGTCLVRAASAKHLGNLADASVATWAASVDAIEQRFPGALIVVPGHGDPGDASLLAHTKALARAAGN